MIVLYWSIINGMLGKTMSPEMAVAERKTAAFEHMISLWIYFCGKMSGLVSYCFELRVSHQCDYERPSARPHGVLLPQLMTFACESCQY